MTQWCKPLSAASTQHYRPVLSRSNSTVTWTHPKIEIVKKEAGLPKSRHRIWSILSKCKQTVILFPAYPVCNLYWLCSRSTSTSWCQHPSAYSHTLDCKTECVLFTKWLTALTFSPWNTSKPCWIPSWITCLKYICFHCNMSRDALWS